MHVLKKTISLKHIDNSLYTTFFLYTSFEIAYNYKNPCTLLISVHPLDILIQSYDQLALKGIHISLKKGVFFSIILEQCVLDKSNDIAFFGGQRTEEQREQREQRELKRTGEEKKGE